MGNSNNIASITAALSLGTITKAQGQGSAAFGERTETTSKAPYSFTCGGYTKTSNWHEFAGGKYNVSNTGSTDADKTLFSVGNGTADNARHNAFEIRQNGDIYISSGETDIKLQDHLGGGGGSITIEAGRGISVTTGETADTVSFNLPISAGTGVDSITEGDRTTASGDYSHTEGGYSTANGNYSHAEGMATITYGMSSHAEGYVTEARNKYEHASGAYNVSSSATTEFGHSGNTLFSVGNGTSSSAKHNAFEIRQNGDIYITKDGQDVKLQDHLGGGGGSITIDPTLDSGSTNAVANSAITNAIYNTARFSSYASNGYLVSISTRDSGNAIAIDGTKIKTVGTSTQQNSTATWLYTSTINGKKAVSSSSSDTKDFNLVDTSAITTSITSSSTDAQVPSAKAVNDKLGGLSIVKLTQSAYDSLSTKDSNTLYVING